MNKRTNLNTTRQQWGKNPVLVSKVGGSGMKTLYWGRLLLVLGMVLTLTLTMREVQAYHEIRPVVLVHGINDDGGGWDNTAVLKALIAARGEDNVYIPTFFVSNLGLCRHGKSIHELGQDLGFYLIYNDLIYPYSPKVDMVAHSLGGLICRDYIEYYNGYNDVHTLTMLSTPNWGTDLTKLAWLWPCVANDTEVLQMMPNSSFLNYLNYDDDVGSYMKILSFINCYDKIVYINDPNINPCCSSPSSRARAAYLCSVPPLVYDGQCINRVFPNKGMPPPQGMILEWLSYHHGFTRNDPEVVTNLIDIVFVPLQKQSLKGAGTAQTTGTRYSFEVINGNEIGWINQVEIRCNDSNAIIESPPEWAGTYDNGFIRWTCSNPAFYISPDEWDNTFSYISEIPLPPLTWRLSVAGVTATLEQIISPSGRLGKGWSIISVPLLPTDAEAPSVLDDIWPVVEDLYHYEPNVGYEKYPSFTYMQHGAGYYVRLSAEGEETLSGTNPGTDMEIALAEGWNLIGHPFVYPVALSACQISDGAVTKSMQEAQDAGWILARIYFYDDNSYKIVNIAEPRDDDSLRPWYGYWILSRQPELTLIVPSDGEGMGAGAEGGKGTSNDLDAFEVDGISNLRIHLEANDCTSWDFHAGIEAGGASDGNDQFDMPAPPVPPPGLTEVRLTTEVAPQGPQMYDYRPPPPTGSKIWNATAYSVNFQSGQCKQVTMTWDLSDVGSYGYKLVNVGSGEIVTLVQGGEYSFEICNGEVLSFEISAILGDFDSSGVVNFVDFAMFAVHWLETDCGTCGGADLTGEGDVDFNDLKKLAENWLAGVK
jgi:pimeloyl-ACP methyl ester carboxylesterase